VPALSPSLVLEIAVMLAVRLMAPIALLISLGCSPCQVAATACPDDPELDLCDAAPTPAPAGNCPDDPELDLCDDGGNSPTPSPSPAGDETQDVSKALSLNEAVHRLAVPLALALGFGSTS